MGASRVIGQGALHHVGVIQRIPNSVCTDAKQGLGVLMLLYNVGARWSRCGADVVWDRTTMKPSKLCLPHIHVKPSVLQAQTL